MARVEERCGALIGRLCAASSLPREFLAALVANESGGDPRALRFEPAVYRHLQAVAAVRKMADAPARPKIVKREK